MKMRLSPPAARLCLYAFASGLALAATGARAETVWSVTQISYDGLGRPVCTAVRMDSSQWGSQANACLQTSGGADRITKNVYDAAGQLLQVRRGVGTSLEQAYATYSYTANGKQQAVIDANGNRAEMRYDGFDRQVRWVFPSTTRPTAYNGATQATALGTAGSLNESDYEAYGYDASGNRTSLRKRDGTTLTYDYDGLGRMIRKLVPERSGLAATNTRDVYYGYDLAGLQTFARFDSTSGEGVANGYDALGRQTSTSSNMDGQSRQLSFVHDANGNRTKTTWPDAAYVTMTFDGLNRMSEIRDANSVALDARTYNSLGLLSNEARPGTAFDQSVSYDTIGRMSGLSITDGNASAQTSWGYTRNAASQILSESRSNDAFAYTGRYNVSRNYTTNGLNQYTAAGPASFCHDANGNLTADGSSVYLYDVENRLVEKRAQTNTTCSSLSYAGPLRASLRYDPLGRLYEVVGTATTRFLYDGDALVGEYSAAGSLLRRYVHGNDVGADDPRVWFEGSAALAANARHLYADPRGSVVLAGDASGNALAIGSYDEYGIPGWSSAAYAPRFQYTGQAWLGEVGMYYYKARIYSPTLGRFLQTDPIGYKDQVNLYAYVGNDPVNSIDPTGLNDIFVGVFGRPLTIGGHSYVVIQDRTTGDVVIVQGGPNPDYPGGFSDIVSDSPVATPNGNTPIIVGQIVSPADAGTDQPGNKADGNEFVSGTVMKGGDFGRTVGQAQGIIDRVNGAETPYAPRSDNSNRFAGDVYEGVTGRDVNEDGGSRWYPGLDNGNLPQCAVNPRTGQCQ